MKYSVIDIGTNSTRLYVADVAGKKQTTVYKALATTRLGEGIGSSDIMGDVPMERTSTQVALFSEQARNMGAEKIFVYATAVTREAKNKDVFVKQIKEKSGIDLDIIPGELEGTIAYLGASNGRQDCGIIDIGGGSTEICTKVGGKFKSFSQKIGGVRLKEKFASADGTVNAEEVKKYVRKNFLEDYEKNTDIRNIKELVAVSGTPTTIASFTLGLKTYVPEKIQDMILKKQIIDETLKKLALMTTSERIEYSGEFAPRADIIVYGACILSSLMEYYNIDSVTVSDRDSLEGYLEYKLNL